MTVHGAKGLEAKLVILADTCGAPDGRHDPKLFGLHRGGCGAGGCARFSSWSTGQRRPIRLASAQARAAIREEARAEHRRLLYVALTRAEDRLVVAGHEGRRQASCRQLVRHDRAGLARRRRPRSSRCPTARANGWSGSATPRDRRRPLRRAESRRRPAGAGLVAPRARRRGARPRAAAPVERRPDDAGSARARRAAAASGGASSTGSCRSLPDLDAPERRQPRFAMRAFLRRIAPRLREPDALLDEVMALLDDPAFAPVFGAGLACRGSADRAHRVRDGHPDYLVSGRIDRLCVGDDEVLIVDFKTSRAGPRDASRGAAGLCHGSSRSTRRSSQRLYPDRPVRAALVWTAAPLLMDDPPGRAHRRPRRHLSPASRAARSRSIARPSKNPRRSPGAGSRDRTQMPSGSTSCRCGRAAPRRGCRRARRRHRTSRTARSLPSPRPSRAP